jgi:hypothetical protein
VGKEYIMPHFDIPNSVEDVLDDNATFDPAALAAVKALARSKPWQGTDEERVAKFNACAAALAAAYSIPAWTVKLGDVAGVDPVDRVLTMEKLSVVTFLNAMTLARGCTPFAAFRWSINIFRRCFPRSYAQCQHVGPYLVR